MSDVAPAGPLGDRWVVMELSGRHAPRRGGGPLARVCGLRVLVRNLLLLQRAGLGRAILLGPEPVRREVELALAEEPRLHLPVTWAGTAADLIAASAGSRELLRWPGAASFGRFLPKLATSALPEESLALLPMEAGSPAEGPALLSTAALGKLQEQESLGALLDRLALEGQASRQGLDHGLHLVLDADDVREAEAALLRSLRKPVDGAVARFDRYLSLAVSRRLMRFPISPNQVTVLAGLLGVVCGVIAAMGGYWPMLIAALGFQANSILDGIDGEIARAKLLESRLGQWLDTLADDSSNLSFSVGVCLGSYRTFGAPIYLGLGVVTGVGFLITAALMYHYVITVARSGDLNDFKMPWEEAAGETGRSPTGLSAVLARLKFVVRRDTFVFLSTCFALLGELRVMAWFFAAGATSVWVAILGYRVLRPALQRRG